MPSRTPSRSTALALVAALTCTAIPHLAAVTVQQGDIVGWGGLNQSGELSPPADVADLAQISAGGSHTLGLTWDGHVRAWGYDVFGQADVPGGLDRVEQISAGDYHSLALKRDGTIVAWGAGYLGQLDVPPAALPQAPPAGLFHWGSRPVRIAAGGFHSLALLSDLTVVGWGYNGYGQTTPPAGLNGVVAIAAGAHHSLALRWDGTITGWGWNDDGEATPPAGLYGVVAIAAGSAHSLALKWDGTVVGWGWNLWGQCTPPAGLHDVVAIAAGFTQSLALKRDGTVVAWGSDFLGETEVPAGLQHVRWITTSGFGSFSEVLTRPARGPCGFGMMRSVQPPVATPFAGMLAPLRGEVAGRADG